jgi:hypothetical protein
MVNGERRCQKDGVKKMKSVLRGLLNKKRSGAADCEIQRGSFFWGSQVLPGLAAGGPPSGPAQRSATADLSSVARRAEEEGPAKAENLSRRIKRLNLGEAGLL